MNILFTGFWVICALVWLLRAGLALRTLKTLPSVKPSPGPEDSLLPLISVVIPAKNEESNIRVCVEGLLKQDYPDYEIIVINDNSRDRTGEILDEMGACRVDGKPGRLRRLDCPPAPEGWTGKNHALTCGVPFARGEWLLFTDADTRHEPSSLSASHAHMEKAGLDFLTLLPRCLATGFFENLIQPAAMGFIGLWFPMHRVNNASDTLHFANGQFILVRKKAYEQVGGHKAVAPEFLEDFGLMRLMKESGFKVQCALGEAIYGTRMYDSLRTLWRGWRRIYLHAFRQKPFSLLIRAFSVFLFSVLPFLMLVPTWGLIQSGEASPGLAVAAGLSMIILLGTCWKGYAIVRAKAAYSLLHPLAALMIAGILGDAARMALTGRKTKWR